MQDNAVDATERQSAFQKLNQKLTRLQLKGQTLNAITGDQTLIKVISTECCPEIQMHGNTYQIQYE